MASQFDSLAPAEFQTSKWRDSLTWSALIVIGILIYEFTTQPIVGVIVVCSKFGWNDFLIAYLLRRVDSNQKRGRTVSWFCVASGLLNVVYASMFLGIGLFISLAPFGQAAFQGMLMRTMAAFGTLFFCYLLISVATLQGVYLAARTQTKPWLTIPWLLRQRNGKEENFADALLVFALLPLWFLLFGLFPLLGSLIDPQGIALVPSIFCVGLPWICLTFFALGKTAVVLKKRYLAATPFECWDGDYLGKVMVAKISSSRRAKLLMQMKHALAQGEQPA